MKRVIFTTYDDIDLVEDKWGTSGHARHQINEYFDRLVQNKKDYASKVGAKFVLFYNTMNKNLSIGDNQFTKVNLYKHQLFAELAKDYDEVMYVDMDVVFNTNENVFEELDLSKGIHIKDRDEYVKNKDMSSVLYEMIGKRSPDIKYYITKDLLDGQDNHVMNTGIMIGRAGDIKKIKYAERMIEAAKKIEEIKSENISRKDAHFLRTYYYPNNESIFSYIVEKYKVPYVLMNEEWHYILDRSPVKPAWDKIKIAHFVNKKFNTYFEDKTTCIFSIYIDIPENKLDNPRGHSDDPVNKSLRTKQRLLKYKDHLYNNHVEYANAINSKYILFGYDDEYIEFSKRFPDLTEYDIINLYKVWLLDKLTHDYDLVLYIDYDVYFHNKVNAFNYLNAETVFCCNSSTKEEVNVRTDLPDYFETYDKDFRNPQAKYWNAHALLQEEDIDGDNCVFNTGIMMASRKVMEQIDYFSDINEVIETMKELKEFSMYPPKIQSSFGYDNETIMAYKVVKNNVQFESLNKTWHNKHEHHAVNSYTKGTADWHSSKLKLEKDVSDWETVMTHFISKNFGLVFDK